MEKLPVSDDQIPHDEVKAENHEVLNFPDGGKRESTMVHPITGDKIKTIYGPDGKPAREGHYNAQGELEYWLEYTNDAIDPIEHRVDANTTLEDLTKDWGEGLDKEAEAA